MNNYTSRESHRRREMYCGHARLYVCLCVCLSAAACLHYCTDPDVTWGSGRGCHIVVHCWADLQSVHGLRCYGNRNAWQSPAVIRHAHRTPHALRMPAKTPLTSDNACCVRNVKCIEAVPFRPYCGGVVTLTRTVSEYMLVLALCLVRIIDIAHYITVNTNIIFGRHRLLCQPQYVKPLL